MPNNEIVAPIAADASGASDTDAPPARRPGLLAPLRRRNFSLLFSGQLISTLGDAAYALALPWTVLAATGDPRQMAVVLAAEAVARVLMLLIGGALADRLSPRIVLLAADLGRTVVVGVLGVALFAGLPPLWVVALLAGLQGAGSGLFQPGVGALIPRTVSEAELPGANGLIQVILFLSLAFGPLLGGVATAAQASVAFLADAGSFLVSALTIFGIRLPTHTAPPTTGDIAESSERSSMLHDIGAGFRYGLGMPLLRTTMLLTTLGNFAFAGVMGVALIVIARSLSPSPVTLGVLLALLGVGGILGGLSAAALGRVRRRGVVAVCLWVVIGVAMALVPLAAGPASRLAVALPLTADQRIPAVAALMALIGLLLALTDAMFLTIMQQKIAPEYMARVFSIQFLAGGITQPLSLVVAGSISALYGPGIAFLAGGGLLLLVALIGISSRELRRV